MLVGGQSGLDPKMMIQAAQTAMVGLDTWTGKTGILPLDRTADDLCSWVVILENNKRFDHFLKEVRKKYPAMRHNGEGADLSKQIRTVNIDRVAITTPIKSYRVTRFITPFISPLTKPSIPFSKNAASNASITQYGYGRASTPNYSD